MCVTLGSARLTSTKILAAEVMRGGRSVRVLAYGNTVANGPDPQSAAGPGFQIANAMLLPFPAKPGSMGEHSVVDTSTARSFLNDMAKPVENERMSRGVSQGAMTLGAVRPALVFESGIYTVVMSDNASAIADAMHKVPLAKRPTLPQGFVSLYERWYPGWALALCCFNVMDTTAASPMLWWYEPMDDQMPLFAPALDAHDGGLPEAQSFTPYEAYSNRPRSAADDPYVVTVDHTILFGSHRFVGAHRTSGALRSTEVDQAISSLLPTTYVGQMVHGAHANGDFVMSIAELNKGRPAKALRVQPPGL